MNRVVADILLLAALASSCSTGIETTKTIDLSREDRKVTAPTAEEEYLAHVVPQPYGEWQPGKLFVVTDSRASAIYRCSVAEADLGGATLEYTGSRERILPDATSEVVLNFSIAGGANEGADVELPTGRCSKSMENYSAEDMPMTVDYGYVRTLDDMLRGKELWTRTQQYYGADGCSIRDRKFVRITIDSVTVGKSFQFPVNLWMTASDGKPRYIAMSDGHKRTDSRRFAALAYLSDPRDNYKKITDGVWDKIQRGVVDLGMTKDECRLSLGIPSEVESGHDYQKTIEIWKYPSGELLRFEDGLLTYHR